MGIECWTWGFCSAFVALLNRFRIFSCLSLFVSLPPGSLLGVMILRDACMFGRRGTRVLLLDGVGDGGVRLLACKCIARATSDT